MTRDEEIAEDKRLVERAWVAEAAKEATKADKQLSTFTGDYLRPRLELMTCPKAVAARGDRGRIKWWADDQLCAGPDCADCVLLRTLRMLGPVSRALGNASFAITVRLALLEEPAPVTAPAPAVTPAVTNRGRTLTCESCGETFSGVRSDARYCSPACRQRAYRERR